MTDAPRPWVKFENDRLIFVTDGLTIDEILAINAYIKMTYATALRTDPETGRINLLNLETRDMELHLLSMDRSFRELHAIAKAATAT